MDPVFGQNRFVVKEQVGLFRAANHYDIFDPTTNRIVLECREQGLSPAMKFVRLMFYRRTPFDIRIRTPEGEPVLRIKRRFSLRQPKVMVCDGKDQLLGVFKQRFATVVEKYDVLDHQQRPKYLLQRSLGGREFQFLQGNTQLAHIQKLWAGLGRELFTSADTYELDIAEQVAADDPVRMLIVAAVVTIDMLLYE